MRMFASQPPSKSEIQLRGDARSEPQPWRFLWHKCWTGVGVAFLQVALYMSVGRADVARSTELLRTHLDDAIPFWPWTSFLYLPLYLAVFVLTLVATSNRRTFHRMLLAMALVGLAATLAHILIPATYPRPVLSAPYADFGERFMAFVQRIDPPSNVFPSLHVAHSTALSLMLLRDRPRAGRVALAMTFVLTLSTLTTKQHFLADLVSGGALGWAAARVARLALEVGRAGKTS